MDLPLIKIENVNSVYNRILAEPDLLQELSEAFTFYAKGYQFHPAYRNRVWDGKIRLLNQRTKQLYYGLYPRVEQFCRERNYECELLSNFSETEFSVAEAETFIKSVNLPDTLKVRDYQLKTFIRCIRKGRALVLSPTASGKSLIIYLLTRYYGSGPHGGTLIIVPTINLVHQMETDFKDYGATPRTCNIQKIYAGQDQCPAGYDVTITTWQSIYKNAKGWFSNFKNVIVDEAHGAKAKSLVTVMEKTFTLQNKFGFTGTLDDLPVHQYVLEGLFGPIVKLVSTKELQDQGYLSPLRIKCIVLKYPNEDRRLVSKMTYQQEQEWIFMNQRRNNFLKNLALSLKGNSLILFRYVDKHGVPLYNMIEKEADYPVYYVAGSVGGEDREEIRRIVETHDKSTTVASSGVFSTGVNIVNLHNIVSSASFKSRIRILQSIGRGLRESETKERCTWYDIVDDLSWKGRRNFSLQHFQERIQLYNQEGWDDYKIYNVNLK